MSAVSIKKLAFAYNKSDPPVLSDLDLEIPAGSVSAILGPNGSGKTTLLHLILGLIAPMAGEMLIFGKSRSRHGEKKIKQVIGIVSQSEILPFGLSLMEYVLLGRAPFLHLFSMPGQKDRDIAREALETVGLSDLAHRPVPSLSGGERQLGAVARALAQTPALLLLDEPTSHLDLANSRRLLKLMKRISGEERTVIFTTHDPNAASSVADHVILFGRAHLVASGRPAQVLTGDLLSETYGEPVEVVQTEKGPLVMTL
ncbi:MAG: ABC transporter ATP-binding protein [Pseudomonadota bacterium]